LGLKVLRVLKGLKDHKDHKVLKVIKVLLVQLQVLTNRLFLTIIMFLQVLLTLYMMQ
jgi:hypothetical protein